MTDSAELADDFIGAIHMGDVQVIDMQRVHLAIEMHIDQLARGTHDNQPWDGRDENGCPAEKHGGVDCPGDACRYAR